MGAVRISAVHRRDVGRVCFDESVDPILRREACGCVNTPLWATELDVHGLGRRDALLGGLDEQTPPLAN
jgi:hypothetical protein